MSASMYDSKALTLVDRFETYVNMRDSLVSISEVLKTSVFTKIFGDLRDDYDRQTIKYSDLRQWLTKKNECGDLITRYNLIDDVPMCDTDQVAREIKAVVAKFAEFDCDSDDEGEEMDDKAAPQGPTKLPPVAEDFLTFVRKSEKGLKHHDEALLRAALMSPLIDDETREDFVLTTGQGSKFQKHICQVFANRKANDMASRMELVCIIRDFSSTARDYIKNRGGGHGHGGGGGRSGGYGNAHRHTPTPPPRHAALSFAATTGGFLSYVRTENMDLELPPASSLPEWGTVCTMFANETDEECAEALIPIGFEPFAATKVIKCFRVFFKAHLAESNKKIDKMKGGAYGLDDDVPKPKKDSDADDSDRETGGGGFMSRPQQMEAYLKGHPEAEDSLRRNKNLDFYRGAKAMQPYNSFIDDFHEGMPGLRSSKEEGDGEADSVPTATNAGVEDQAADGMGEKSKSHEDPHKADGPRSAAAGRRNLGKGKNQWFGNYSRLEVEHSYIQWLFPIQEGGGMSSTSQRLHKHELLIFQKDTAVQTRFVRSYQTMLDFFGMVLLDKNSGAIGRKPNNKEQYDNLNTSSHNYLRITRILKCLGEVGFEHYKQPWVEFFLREIYEHQELTNCHTSCLDYWMCTMRSDEATTALKTLQEDLEKKHGVVKSTYAGYGGSTTGVQWWEQDQGPTMPDDFDESALPPDGSGDAAAAANANAAE